MSGADVKLAIIGFGQIARQHLEVFNALGARTVAAVNRSEAGRARATEAGIGHTYADTEEMIERERPDALLVTASVLSIFDVAARAIPFRLPILLEKPPGVSPDECRRLADLAAQHATPVMVGLNRRFYSVYHRALDAMGGRKAVTGVSVEWSEDAARMLELGHPPEMLPLLNYANSLHGIDLLTFFGGAGARGTAWGRDLGGETYRWQMAFDGESEGGVRLHFASNWDVPGRWRLVVDAPGARMVSAPLETALLLRRGHPPLELVPAEDDRRFKPGFHSQAASFLQVVREGRPIDWPACSLQEATLSLILCELLTEAVRTGRPGLEVSIAYDD